MKRLYYHFRLICSFNVAASIKMRKSFEFFRAISPLEILQCGRIYKDAEIFLNLDEFADVHDILQCGRIYKDAEIYVLILSE